ncbi:MAG TPA: GNAT family N-acetyltransferase [Azospirillaceae bacterium]|nr:GNAT family N-acetyltransferase [Azospirillaceae bacterium]
MESHATDARAYLHALRHMFVQEMVGQAEDFNGITAIHYASPILHPSPREFSFHTEFLTPETNAPAVVKAITARLLPGEDHVLTIFAPNAEAVIGAYAELGYVHAWTGSLMAVGLDDAPAQRPVANAALKVRRVTTLEDLEAGDLLEAFSPSPRRVLDDPAFNTFIAELADYVIAKGRLIATDPVYGHVCRFFTEPVSRRQGAATAILNGLHERARGLGLKRLVLMPSKSARGIGFFEKFGYRDTAPMMVLVPRG